MHSDNYVVCPLCGKVHFIINKKGDLKNTIHCRCKSKKYKNHNIIFWLHGVGYQIITDNMKIIDV